MEQTMVPLISRTIGGRVQILEMIKLGCHHGIILLILVGCLPNGLYSYYARNKVLCKHGSQYHINIGDMEKMIITATVKE